MQSSSTISQNESSPPHRPQHNSEATATTSSPSSTTMLSLYGKKALVTGGAGTIGKAISRVLLKNGATVVLTGRRMEKLEEAKVDLLKDLMVVPTLHDNGSPLSDIEKSQKIQLVKCDISQEDSVIELFKEMDRIHNEQQKVEPTRSSSSSIDLLINNAGCNIPGQAEDITANDMERVLGVNVTGSFLCAREAMKRMKASDATTEGGAGGGRIINIGSISAESPRPGSVAYTTSKFALLGLTKSLALDGRRHNIAVGIIHPGNVVSELLSEEEVKARSETEGFIQADDVAQCVMTMASLPYSANVLELTVIPTTQPLVGRG